jgi:hypothetical protein
LDSEGKLIPVIADAPSLHTTFLTYAIPVLLLTFLVWSASACIAYYSRRKGRTWASMFWVGVLISPLISGVIVAAVTEVYHPDELVECPTCSTKIRFNAKKCLACGQTLTPNSEVGRDIVNRTATWNVRFKWVPHIVTAIGAIWVVISLVVDDAALLKDLPALAAGWLVLGVGASLWVVARFRQRMLDDLYFELAGEQQ